MLNADVTVDVDATISGGGQFPDPTVGIAGTLAIDTGGNLNPGHSPGILNVGGLALASGANFHVQIFGPDPGTGYDQVLLPTP